MRSSEVIRQLKDDGWELRRVKGRHHHFGHPTKPGILTVPHPVKDLKVGILKRIEHHAGVKLE